MRPALSDRRRRADRPGNFMMQITIDGERVMVSTQSTVLEVAKDTGITIPTLCFNPNLKPSTSCMLCIVEDRRTSRLLPACDSMVADGMEISTDSDNVLLARREALELLMKEHRADCLGPCQVSCPVGLDIPRVINMVRRGSIRDAEVAVREFMPIPGALSRICPAPCERGCRRRKRDESVAIKALLRALCDRKVAEQPMPTPDWSRIDDGSVRQQTVAVVGSGPAGLAAAHYLLQAGYDCTVYEKSGRAGGTLRSEFTDATLPDSAVDREIEHLTDRGCRWQFSCNVGVDLSASAALEEHDAMVIASGSDGAFLASDLGIPVPEGTLQVATKTFETTCTGVFAIGSAVRPLRRVITACRQAQTACFAVSQFLSGKPVFGRQPLFNSTVGRLEEGEIETLMQTASSHGRALPVNPELVPEVEQCRLEAKRCLHCECAQRNTCALRSACQTYEVNQRKYRTNAPEAIGRTMMFQGLKYESGKCIRCGACVRIAETAGEKFGPAFIGRGFDVRVDRPFGKASESGTTTVAQELAENCPTAALSWEE